MLFRSTVDDSSLAAATGKGMASGLTDMTVGAPLKRMSVDIDRAFVTPRQDANKKMSDKLRNIQRQIMLEELASTDPVLADEDPEKIMHAYNSLLQIAPEMSTNKEVVRAILRQSVHSVATSPYDAEQWGKVEQQLRNVAGKSTMRGPGVEGAGAVAGGKR